MEFPFIEIRETGVVAGMGEIIRVLQDILSFIFFKLPNRAN